MRLTQIAALCLAASLSTAAFANDKVAAVVNGTEIPQAELDAFAQQVVNSSGGRVKDSPELRAELKQQMINRTVILQEANRRGLEKTPEFKNRMEIFRKDLLQQALFEDIAKQNPVTEAQVKTEYDRIKARLAGQKEMRARQIVLNSEAEAQEIISQLKKGGKFDELAKQKSKDPAAKRTGGEMGWVNLGAVPPQLADALKALGKNQVSSQALRSDVGFHVFKVEDIRDAKVPTFEEVRPQLQRQMQSAQIEKVLIELRNKAKIQ